ncbi:complex I subunit 4 family protein [Yinghuangia seranimata]|uniref:complex I subunit 4 family protein n=1 Tax=Yinghuangia seranimata TaxID=408067 RepID=UPI00248D034F|nr:NADH-quinone oxidoreductase subunit M [Yinghuangia seranimata]MDI2126959.1 NADH-quinone oxidoreductase subunit M [Yinghuangia seranimata]
MSVVLIVAIVLPLIAGSALIAFPVDDRRARYAGVAVTGAVLGLTVVLAGAFDRDDARTMQFETDRAWASSLGLRFHLGVDGISLPLIVLTALLTFLVAVHSLGKLPDGGSARAYVALVLVLEAGVLGTFAALDLILFFLAFEVVLVPMYFLIARWGTPGERGPAAFKFILYTLLGSALMLLGFLLVQAHTGTFDITELAARGGDGMSRGVQITAFLAIGLGLAVKVPMWPLHTWLPDAHTAAPTGGSVLLAGVLLKMGTYGLVRIAVPALPQGAEEFAPYLGAFGAVGIVYGSLVCLALLRSPDGDLKRIIAYSSVGHMGFALLGIATLTAQGINGALFVNIGHGLITGLLFFLAGAVKERSGTALLGRIGGSLYARAPRLGGLLAFAAVAGLGLPGLAGFWGELLAMYGAYHPADELSRGLFLVLLVAAALGTVLTAAYMLGIVRAVCGGPGLAASGTSETDDVGPMAEGAPLVRVDPLPDVGRVDVVAWAPLVAFTVVLGLWPATLLAVTDPAVRALLGGGA